MTRLLVVLACSVWRVPSGLLQPQPVCTVGSSYLPALSCVWTCFLPSWFMIDIIPKLCSSAQRWHATQVAAAQQPQEVESDKRWHKASIPWLCTLSDSKLPASLPEVPADQKWSARSEEIVEARKLIPSVTSGFESYVGAPTQLLNSC